MTYYIVGLIAIIFLYKIFEERGFGWSYLFSLLLYIVMGIIFNKFVPMFNYGTVRFGCEIALILLTIREIMQKSTKNGYFYSIFFLSIIALTLFNLTPVQTMLTFTILGVLYKKFLEVES